MPSYSSGDDEYDSDEPPELALDLEKLKVHATECLHATCIEAKRLTRGSWHEIFVLTFERTDTPAYMSLATSEFRCIARFFRINDATAKEISEMATIRYVRQNTTIPVPEIYYQNLDSSNDVGAAYVLMEMLPGRHLYKMWDTLSLSQKMGAMGEIASVVVQLSSLHFSKIGSLYDQGVVGPLLCHSAARPMGPFATTRDFLLSFVSTSAVESPQLSVAYQSIRDEIDTVFTSEEGAIAYLQPPFALIHTDFDGQNMLFTEPRNDLEPPRFTGLIDFEYAYAGPRYFLFEPPIFIQDVSWSEHLFAENAKLRACFVREIFHRLPSEEERVAFIACMNAKSYFLNGFRDSFMSMPGSEHARISLANSYLESLRDGTGAYCGREDYSPEFYSATGEPV